jgi:ankyrin repeat protein
MKKILLGISCILITLLIGFTCWAENIHDVVRLGNLTKVKKLIEQGVPIDIKDNNGVTPLHIAAGFYPKIVKYLVEQGASIDAVDIDGYTALHYGAELGEIEVVKYLIGKGANINVQDIEGQTPLDRAKWAGAEEVVKYLISQGAK